MESESKGTVVVALLVNVAIAVAKTVAGLLSLSSAMLAEAAHSWADSTNQVFLLFALKRSSRPPDPTHPFGYGQERYFWSLLAAVGIFVTGALFSIYHGVQSLLEGGGEISGREFVISYVVLAVSLVLEGTSLTKAVRQLRAEAHQRRRGFLEHVRRSNDPTVKTVASEDSAAVTGLVLAAIGLALHQITGSPVYDAAASIAIGLLLAWVAYALGRDTKELLIGESADPELRLEVIEALFSYDGVKDLLDMLTMQLGPDHVLVAAKVDFGDELSSGQVEALCNRIENDLAQRFPVITHLYLDATTPNRVQRDVSVDLRALAEHARDGEEQRLSAVESLRRGTWHH